MTGLVAALVGILVMLSPFGPGLEERFGLSWLFWTRGQVSAPADVAVVSLDRRSAEELGLPAKPRDWPRGKFARLIERLVELNASVVVFDLVLDRPREPADDAALAAAIATAKRVVLFEFLDARSPDRVQARREPCSTADSCAGPCRRSSRARRARGPSSCPRCPRKSASFDLQRRFRFLQACRSWPCSGMRSPSIRSGAPSCAKRECPQRKFCRRRAAPWSRQPP